MKLTTPKLLIILISLASGVLVVGVFIVRRHRARSAPKVEAKRYPHQHLPSSEWEAGAKLPATPYTLISGTIRNFKRVMTHS